MSLPPLVLAGHPRRRGAVLLRRDDLVIEPLVVETVAVAAQLRTGQAECVWCRALVWEPAGVTEDGYLCQACFEDRDRWRAERADRGRPALPRLGIGRPHALWTAFVRLWAGLG